MANVPNLNLLAAASMPKFDPLPNGDYLVHIIESDCSQTTRGTAIKVTLQVLDGPNKNRRIWLTMYVEHPDQPVAQLAYRELIELREAVGQEGDLVDTEQLHGIQFIARVYTRPAMNGFAAKNGATRFRQVPMADQVADTSQERVGGIAA